ncbi:MAG: hypothetical protein HY657_05070 [Acidobacteria bacterium]|nr:hypothetical protein [Acidobacteriota bacterium]
MSLPAGTRLGPYEVVSLLGMGGMGEVYKARDTRLDRTVALKVLPSHVAGAPEFRERFEREVRTIAALNRPHICTLDDPRTTVAAESGHDRLHGGLTRGTVMLRRTEIRRVGPPLRA